MLFTKLRSRAIPSLRRSSSSGLRIQSLEIHGKILTNRNQRQSLKLGKGPSDEARWAANDERRQSPLNIVPAVLAVCGILCPQIIGDPCHAERLSIPIARSQDDVKELLGEDFVGLDSSDLELGTQILPFNLGTWRQSVGLRFLDIGIPPGSTISNASIQFMVDEPSTVDTSLLIYGELAPDSAPFRDVGGNVTDRVRMVEPNEARNG